MPIVINHAPKWAQAAIGAGKGLAQGMEAKDQHDRYKAEIQRALLALQGEAQRQSFAAEDQDIQRAQAKRSLAQQDQNIEAGKAKLDAFQQDRSAQQADKSAMAGGSSPFEAVLLDPNIPPQVRTQLTRDSAIYGKLSTPEYRQQFAHDSLSAAREAVQQHHREEMKAGIQDRLARGDYGEDEAVHKAATGLGELLDSGADPQQVAKQDVEMRVGVAKGMQAQMAKERFSTYILTQIAALPPQSVEADQLERVFAAYQSGIIPNDKVDEAVQKAMAPAAQKGTSPIELRKAAHAMAVDEAKALGNTDPKALRASYEQHLADLMQEGQQGKQPDPSGQIPFEQAGAQPPGQPSAPPSLPPDSPAAPATPQKTAASVQQAQQLTKGSPEAQERALSQAAEAWKAGDRAKAVAILKAAGIDPAKPLPAVKRRTAGAGGSEY